VRAFLGIVLWVGVFTVIREWVYARKNGAAITVPEKLSLAFALPLGLAAQLVVETAGFNPGDGTMVGLVIGVVLNGFAITRRRRRKSAEAAANLIS
jgi:hypothetical protein